MITNILRFPDPLEPLRPEPSSVGPEWPLWLIVGGICVCGAAELGVVGAMLMGWLP